MLKADPSSKSRVANDALGVGLRLLEDFDAENLAQLREIDGGALLTRTLQSFAVEIGTSRTDLAGLIAKRDTFGACRLVHKLVGFGDILGARTLSAKLRKFGKHTASAAATRP